MDKIRNEYIRGPVGRFGEKTRGRSDMYGGKMKGILEEGCSGWNWQEKMKRGRFKRRFMDAVSADMAVAELTKDDAEDRNKWRWKICGGDC